MELSILCEAMRTVPLTKTEQIWIDRILERYNQECPWKGSMIEAGGASSDPVSAAKDLVNYRVTLPMCDTPEQLLEAANYWLKCLTELRKAVPSALWKASAVGIRLIWESTGWRFPNDDEIPDDDI